MKKKLLSLLTCCAVITVSLAGCKNASTSEKESDESKVSETEDVSGETTEEETTAVSDGNMIINGNFDKAQILWYTYMEGGKESIKKDDKNNTMVISIDDVGSLNYACQAYYDGFTLEEGCKYKMSFDACSSIPRTIEWRVQINGGDYHPYSISDFNLTSEMQTFEIEFTMEEASDPAPRMCFNMGVNEGASEGCDPHTITFDNIKLVLEDETGKKEQEETPDPLDININQVGYRPNDIKTAIFKGKTVPETFDVINTATEEVVYTGTIGEGVRNTSTSETDHSGDFSDVKEPGKYIIKAGELGESYEFEISEDVYDALSDDVLKMLYLQRCGMELTEEEAGVFAHPACHTSEATIYGTDIKKDVSGGWHDAGDYGRYVVAGATAVADLLLAYEDYGNEAALDEAKYELDWMFKMQDENSGGVYHKVTCTNFPGEVMPEEETNELIISPISSAATGDFAAVMAMASTLYKDEAYKSKCLEASKKAYEYLLLHSAVDGFENPEDIVTGEYPDDQLTDEIFWAACELYKATGESKYHDEIKNQLSSGMTPAGLGWASVGYFGVYAYLTTNYETDEKLAQRISDDLIKKANVIIISSKKDGYFISLGDVYPWGSNMTISNNAMTLLMANRISPNEEYVEYAKKKLDYLLGANSISYCFVTGYGTISPKNAHHRPSMAKETIMKGMLVGGPNSNLEDPYAKAVLKGKAPAKCYADNSQSFSCNEVTIYWNTPLVYMLSGLK